MGGTRAEVGRLLDRLGRTTAQETGSLSPVHRSVVASLAALIRLGYPCEGDYLAEQRAADASSGGPGAGHDGDVYPTEAEEESARRFGL